MTRRDERMSGTKRKQTSVGKLDKKAMRVQYAGGQKARL